jgi:class 3 adenylate cyclase
MVAGRTQVRQRAALALPRAAAESRTVKSAAEGSLGTTVDVAGCAREAAKLTSMDRRLAAILHADIVGYSRLVGRDDVGTARRLRTVRSGWDASIAKHLGRVVGTAGDSLLVIFPTVIGAVDCAIEMQQGMTEHNRGLDLNQRMLLRIGVNLGDIIVDEHEVIGDGVNVAARLQALADAGGICISRPVLDAISGRTDARFINDGEHRLKNIVKPIQVFRWAPSGELPDTSAPTLASPRLVLLLEGTDSEGRTYRLRIDPTTMHDKSEGLIIGRQTVGCDLMVLHQSISRRHARVRLEGAVMMIEDLGSKNGTSVGGVTPREGAAVPLLAGRTLKLGDVTFEVRAAPSEDHP